MGRSGRSAMQSATSPAQPSPAHAHLGNEYHRWVNYCCFNSMNAILSAHAQHMHTAISGMPLCVLVWSGLLVCGAHRLLRIEANFFLAAFFLCWHMSCRAGSASGRYKVIDWGAKGEE